MLENNVLILYGTTTGNSERVADFCHQHISNIMTNIQIDIFNVADIVTTFDIDNQYAVIIICTSTWGVEPAVLQDDFELFWYRNLNKNSIRNKKFAILALGDDYYPHFAYAATILENEILKYNGIITLESMKIQDPWEDSQNAIIRYLQQLLNTCIH